jgi:hypothetical protein
MNYFRAALRFWWLLLAGAAVGSLVLLVSVYRVEKKWPPRFVTKNPPTFTATTELLVDSPSGPYLRTATDKPTSIKGLATKNGASSSAPTVTTEQGPAVPTKPLVDAANLYPLYIESDEVARLRIKRFGNIPGSIDAKALYSVRSQNRYRPSTLPVIQITGTAKRPKNAVALAEATAKAFTSWLGQRQAQAHIPPIQRIIVLPLHAATHAARQSGTHYGLPLLLAFVVFGAFVGLAVVLDHMFPRRPDAAAVGAEVGEAEEEAPPSLSVASRSHSS